MIRYGISPFRWHKLNLVAKEFYLELSQHRLQWDIEIKLDKSVSQKKEKFGKSLQTFI